MVTRNMSLVAHLGRMCKGKRIDPTGKERERGEALGAARIDFN